MTMNDPRFINCEACGTEGRMLTNNGGPYDVDHGPCPVCNGECVIEIEAEPVTLDDLEIEAREECARQNIDPDDICADGGVTAWMVVQKDGNIR